jgi:hypothetical protein
MVPAGPEKEKRDLRVKIDTSGSEMTIKVVRERHFKYQPSSSSPEKPAQVTPQQKVLDAYNVMVIPSSIVTRSIPSTSQVKQRVNPFRETLKKPDVPSPKKTQ